MTQTYLVFEEIEVSIIPYEINLKVPKPMPTEYCAKCSVKKTQKYMLYTFMKTQIFILRTQFFCPI